MSKLRIYVFLSIFLLAAVLAGISTSLNVKSKTLSRQILSEFHQYMRENGTALAGEMHFSDEEEKEASRLFLEANSNKENLTLKRYRDGAFLGFLSSIVLFSIGFLVLIWGLLKKFFCWIFYTPQRAILIIAISFFIGTLLFLPFNFKGHIYYSIFFDPIWNGSQVFWALLLIEWTVVLLPLGLIYKHLYRKSN